jgi:hypothetical protein
MYCSVKLILRRLNVFVCVGARARVRACVRACVPVFGETRRIRKDCILRSQRTELSFAQNVISFVFDNDIFIYDHLFF